MGKHISAGELAEIVTSLLVGRQMNNHLDSTRKYAGFLTDIAVVIADHCGGEVTGIADDSFEKWMVTIIGNDSLPEDGGIWAGFDPEGNLFHSDESDELTCPSCGRIYYPDCDDELSLEEVETMRTKGICPSDDCAGRDDKVTAAAIEAVLHDYKVTAGDVEAVLHDYALRVSYTGGKSFREMSKELADKIDSDRVAKASNAPREIKDILVEMGVLDF